MLRLPSKIWFAFHFLMIDHLVYCKNTLHQVTLDKRYVAFEQDLFNRKNGSEIQRQAIYARKDISLQRFWVKCTKFLHMVQTMLLALFHFDGKIPTMPKTLIIMKALQEHVYSLREALFF